jgi:hypothetical protein
VLESPLVLAISISLAILTLLILSLLLGCLLRNRRGLKKPSAQEPPEAAEVRHTLICPPPQAGGQQEPLYTQKLGQPLPPPPTPVQWSLVYGGQTTGATATYTDSSHYEGNTYEVPRTHAGADLYAGGGGPSPAVSYVRSLAGQSSSPAYGQQQQQHGSQHNYSGGGGGRQTGHSPSYTTYSGSAAAYRHTDMY